VSRQDATGELNAHTLRPSSSGFLCVRNFLCFVIRSRFPPFPFVVAVAGHHTCAIQIQRWKRWLVIRIDVSCTRGAYESCAQLQSLQTVSDFAETNAITTAIVCSVTEMRQVDS
jgi:hypothetical protein